jgi:uncharacterized protein
MTKIPTGRFVWFEYVGPEVKKAQAFYGEVFGWKSQDVPMPGMPSGGTYTMIVANGQTIGGYMGPPKGAPAHHHWLSSLQVEDVAATCAKIKAIGGKVRKDTTRMGDFGTMAVVAGPDDATFALWQPGKPEGTGDYKDTEGSWCWNELATPEPEKAVSFYRAIGGFEEDKMPMGPAGTYHVLKSDGKRRAGVAKPMKPGIPSMWLPYVQVGSADQTTERAKRLGAKVYVDPTDIPDVGRFAIFADPNGAAIGVLQPKR